MLSTTFTFAQTHDCDITEQYVDWGNNINFIFMRDQNLPPPLNNTLIGIIASTLSSWGIKIRHPPMTNVDWGNNINFIFMRDQNSPPLQNNLLIGEITSTLSSWGIKIRKAGHQLRANVHVAANMFLFKKSLKCLSWFTSFTSKMTVLAPLEWELFFEAARVKWPNPTADWWWDGRRVSKIS